jgi:hypothetical protein
VVELGVVDALALGRQQLDQVGSTVGLGRSESGVLELKVSQTVGCRLSRLVLVSRSFTSFSHPLYMTIFWKLFLCNELLS